MTFIRSAFFSLAILAATSTAFAQEAPKVSKDAAAQPAGLYELDPSHTSVVWKVKHMGVSNYTARFNKISGTMNFDPKNIEKSTVDIRIDPTSVDTGSTSFNEEIAGEKFFNSGKHKDLTFKSTKVEKTGTDKGRITGDLTFNGVTKPVVLDVTFNGAITNPMKKVADLGFSATTTIKRSDFGVTQYVPMVGDDVTVAIETEFLKKAQ